MFHHTLTSHELKNDKSFQKCRILVDVPFEPQRKII